MRTAKRLALAGLGTLAVLLPVLTRSAGSAQDAVTALHALFDAEWERTMRENPTWASSLGDRRYNDRWSDMSLEAIERRHKEDQAVLEKLKGIDRAALPPAEQLNYDLFRKEYEEGIEGHRFRGFLMSISMRGGVQTTDELRYDLRFETEQDYKDWIARLRGLGTLVDQNIALLDQGLAEKRTQPRIIMGRVPEQIAAQVVEAPEKSPFYIPLQSLPKDLPAETQETLRAEAKKSIAEVVVPAYGRLQKFFNERYLPGCRESVGAWDLPDGEAYYAFRARIQTTTSLTPEEIHQIGLKEVARIRAEMDKVIQKVGFKGSFEQFLQFMRTDPQFYYKDPNDLIEGYRAICKRIDPELVRLFGKLPRAPYGVIPIPDIAAPHTTTAYYNQPAADGSRAGYYFVNLYKPEVRPKYEMEVLSVHEAVPGHHLQIALAMELGELPKFRRYGGYTAFIEGWGLYSESLGEDLGLYKDPYSKFGQLTYEMWRAVRLVVDTGMHAKQWTRQQAIDYFKQNAAKTEQDIINEIDRYIGWPGQALAYKIGELKLQELRRKAKERLGERFDIKAFHDTVLGSGAVPLDILEQNVNAWVERALAAPAGAPGSTLP
jgi:uncharacterized protein (DUF885 family)